jgi:hypothetical protein
VPNFATVDAVVLREDVREALAARRNGPVAVLVDADGERPGRGYFLQQRGERVVRERESPLREILLAFQDHEESLRGGGRSRRGQHDVVDREVDPFQRACRSRQLRRGERGECHHGGGNEVGCGDPDARHGASLKVIFQPIIKTSLRWPFPLS